MIELQKPERPATGRVPAGTLSLFIKIFVFSQNALDKWTNQSYNKSTEAPEFADCIEIQYIVEVHSAYFFAQLCTYIGGTKIAEKGVKSVNTARYSEIWHDKASKPWCIGPLGW